MLMSIGLQGAEQSLRSINWDFAGVFWQARGAHSCAALHHACGQVEATLVGRLADHKSSVGFVLTHPYGPLGGNLYCNVVSALALYLQVRGFTTVRGPSVHYRRVLWM